jgi:hypothetical protein
LFAIKPKNAPFGVAADYGSFLKKRDVFIDTVAKPANGVRVVLAGHIHRNGLHVVHSPKAGTWLMRGVVPQAVQGVTPPGVAITPHPRSQPMKPWPGPLYVNTTSAGPRGNLFLKTKEPDTICPGYSVVKLSNAGKIEGVTAKQISC